MISGHLHVQHEYYNENMLFYITHVFKNTIPCTRKIRKHAISMVKFAALQLYRQCCKRLHSEKVTQDLQGIIVVSNKSNVVITKYALDNNQISKLQAT